MADIIQLLPDAVANQIAAGEVIQRPASAVKELLENAVDAGATRIDLVTKDSGKTLIQVIDNGSGMSVTDARLSFERHATSKIRSADDLFSIRTMGFRGEAMASIAAIAQVELKTRRHDEETGTAVEIEGARFLRQEAVACAAGTSVSVKNLFFNVPARRNFLKSNGVEARHIIDEFERVALAQPSVAMSLQQNGLEVFRLQPGNVRQRIVGIFGSSYNERLVPVEESTPLMTISGFVGKPEFARKTRGEQFFFVNHRFIRDAYLHHAVNSAFEELLPRDAYPSYMLYLEIDPSRIDINIHPTKTEIKFDDDRSVYAIVRAAVKRALGQFSVTPALDFERESRFDLPYSMRNAPVQAPSITLNPGYNPFDSGRRESRPDGWQQLYEVLQQEPVTMPESSQAPLPFPAAGAEAIAPFQVYNRYILLATAGGLQVIDQQAAHERVLFEHFLGTLEKRAEAVQQKLFPVTLEFSAGDAEAVGHFLEEFRKMGFDLAEFGPRTYVLRAAPPGIAEGQEKEVLDAILEEVKNNSEHFRQDRHETLARILSRRMAIRPGQVLSPAEMRHLVEELLATRTPSLAPDGRPAMVTLSLPDHFGKPSNRS
jgi:DNA mismatch repair protein MutL